MNNLRTYPEDLAERLRVRMDELLAEEKAWLDAHPGTTPHDYHDGRMGIKFEWEVKRIRPFKWQYTAWMRVDGRSIGTTRTALTRSGASLRAKDLMEEMRDAVSNADSLRSRPSNIPGKITERHYK